MTFNSIIATLRMADIPLYLIGMPKDDPKSELFMSKFQAALEKASLVLPDIIEAKISVKSQNPEGSQTHYDVTSTINTSKDTLVYTASDWDILKICDELCRKLEGEMPKHDNKRQRKSIRKKGEF